MPPRSWEGLYSNSRAWTAEANCVKRSFPHSRAMDSGAVSFPYRGVMARSYTAEMICARVSDDSGKPIYLLANFYNITDRMRAEEALLLDDSRLEALAEAEPDG